MKLRPEISYPDNESPKLALLEGLFHEWHQLFAANASALVKHKPDEMVFDGFYPHYFSQKKRVLFIGREPRQIGSLHNMDVLYPAYRTDKNIGPRHLNQDKFHRRMLKTAYGLTSGLPAWEDIPSASMIGDTFGEGNGLSFAFMNISKLSNQSDESSADWPVINAAYALSTQGQNFIQDEVGILEPDIVITMNLIDKLRDELASLGERTPIPTSRPATSYWLTYCGRRSLLIDTWHFSARNKDDSADFYVPICDAIRRSEASSTKP